MPTATLSLVLSHAPFWVWLLLKVLLVLGLAAARDRTLPRAAALLMPAGFASWSLVSAAAGPAGALAGAVAWGLGAAGAAGLARRAGWPRGVRAVPGSTRVFVPGSWWPLALFLALFVAKFTVGALQGVHHPLLASPAFTTGLATVYGAFSGLFLARGLAAWQVARPHLGRLLRPANA